jgi:proline dehydrogenase
MYAGAKSLFFALSRSASLKRLASRYGMAHEDSFARRFIAGETVEEAIAAARTLQARGLHLTLDYLGESVRTLDEASAATREYVRLIEVIVASGIERNISLKLTQLGVDIDRATCVDNMRRILEPADANSVAAKSLTTATRPCARIQVSAAFELASSVKRATITLASR